MATMFGKITRMRREVARVFLVHIGSAKEVVADTITKLAYGTQLWGTVSVVVRVAALRRRWKSEKY